MLCPHCETMPADYCSTYHLEVGDPVEHEHDGPSKVLSIEPDCSLIIETASGHKLHVNACEIAPH